MTDSMIERQKLRDLEGSTSKVGIMPGSHAPLCVGLNLPPPTNQIGKFLLQQKQHSGQRRSVP